MRLLRHFAQLYLRWRIHVLLTIGFLVCPVLVVIESSLRARGWFLLAVLSSAFFALAEARVTIRRLRAGDE